MGAVVAAVAVAAAAVVVAAAAVVEVAAELGGAIFCLSWRSLGGGDDVGD